MIIEEIDPSHVFDDPPDLTASIASMRFREINILIHSLALLGDELHGGGSLLPVLRAATSLAPADRAILYLWDEVSGTLRSAAFLGVAGSPAGAALPEPAAARASLRRRKPVLVWAPCQEFLRRELESLGASGSLSVPMTHRGVPWGVIHLLRDRPFQKDEALLLWLFALVLEGILPRVAGAQGRWREPTAVSRSPHVH
jgi:hypothetical protein